MSETKFQEFLRNNEFRPRDDLSCDSGTMGNSIRAYSNDVLQVRWVTDRAQSFLDVRLTDRDDWRDLFVAMKAANPEFEPRTGSFDEATRTLPEYYKFALEKARHTLI